MPGAVDAAEQVAQHGHLDAGGLPEAPRVELRDPGRPDQCRTRRLEETEVRLRGPGIGVQVLARPELQRVDEDAHDDETGELAGPFHERPMPRVEVTHRGHEGDPLPGLAGLGDGRPDLGDGAGRARGGVHASSCSGPGKVPDFTAST